MSGPFNNYESKVEEAIKQVMESEIAEQMPVHLAFDFEEINEEIVCLVTSLQHDEDEEQIGGGTVMVDVSVMSNNQVTRTQHEDAVALVIDIILEVRYDETNGEKISVFEESLNAVADGIGINLVTRTTRRRTIQDTSRVTSQSLEVMCWSTEE